VGGDRSSKVVNLGAPFGKRNIHSWTGGLDSHTFPAMRYFSRSFDSKLAQEIKSQIVDVYRSVYSLPPYNEVNNQIESFSASWEARVSKNGFLFCGATDEMDASSAFLTAGGAYQATPGI